MDLITEEKNYRVDAQHVLWVPLDYPHADEAVTTLYDTIALYPSAKLLASSTREAALSPTQHRRLGGSCILAKRTHFFSEILERYFFAKIVSGRHIDAFQERQLIGEAVSLFFSPTKTRPGQSTSEEGSIADRCVRHIEANLFLSLTLEEIAAKASASVSSLLRHFRRTFDTTPYDYIKRRRLEEARHLLNSPTHSVGEVALLVGYQDFGSFSKAFRQCFGTSPKQWQMRRQRGA